MKRIKNELTVVTAALAFGCLMAALSLFFVWRLCRVRKKWETAKKQLEKIRYMFQVERMLFDAHTKPECMKNALRKAGEVLTAEETFLLIMNGKTITKQYFWEQSERDGGDSDLIKDCMLLSGCFTPGNEDFISYDTEALDEKYPGIQEVLKRRGIKNLMVTPIIDQNGERKGILGASNMDRRWTDTRPLKYVSLSFSKAISNILVYERTVKTGMMDSLTGLLNRNSYYAAVSDIEKNIYFSIACIYVDLNGLHEVNNHLGHDAGDKMLRFVADELKIQFGSGDTYRIGGDEFVAICRDIPRKEVMRKAEAVKKNTNQEEYYISMGIEWVNSDFNINAIVKSAEKKMQQDKRQFYEKKEDVRKIRQMNLELEKIITEKQDADAFLSVIASEFKGVYFVNLTRDTVRHIFIPSYFEVILNEAGGVFSKALRMYTDRFVMPENQKAFYEFIDYENLEKRLEKGEGTPELAYQKKDGSWLRMKVLKFKKYSYGDKETLWIFEDMPLEEEET